MSEVPPDLFIEPPGPLTPLPKAMPASPYETPPPSPQESPLYVAPSGDLAIAGRDPLLQGIMDWRQSNWARMKDALDQPLMKYDPADPLGVKGAHLDLDNPLLMAFAGPGAIRGYHGTPHLFPAEPEAPFGRFRDEAIGTGEGAQAYGWGHYVARAPEVAQTYKGGGTTLLDNKPIANFYNHPEYGRQGNLAINFLGDAQGDVNKALGFLNDRIEKWGGEETTGSPIIRDTIGARNLLQSWNEAGRLTPSQEGHLLEVHILPEEHELLDWDRPLSEQSPQVQAGLKNLAEQKGFNDPALFSKSGYDTGEHFYRGWANDLGSPEAASQALHEAGIPGLRYLDAGSRGKSPFTLHAQDDRGNWFQVRQNFPTKQSAQNFMDKNLINAYDWRLEETPLTSNYVIFHPSNLRITARNGQRLEPVDHDPFAPQE